MSDNIQQTIVDLLNQASIYGKDNIRVQHLRHVQELILRKDPNLLDQFLEEVLTFQTDKSIEVKKTIISFIEEACQLNPKIILKVIDNLHFLLYDDNLFVQKKLILSLISIYKSTLIWLSKSDLIDENVDRMWRTMTDIKNHIISQINSDNDGLCLVIIKFIEMLIIILIQYEQDFVRNDNKIFSRNQEGEDLIEKLIEFTLSPRLSNVHLIAAIEAITNIIRYRSDYINRVLQTFEILQNNLPSTLNDSQINNVRKIIKLKLFNLLKYSISSDSQSEIRNLLTNLGCTQTEILKYLPKIHPESKRKLTSHHQTMTKKLKNITDTISLNDHLMEKLSIKNVVDLVIASMRFLPEEMPGSFQALYTPIKDAGSPVQIEHLARLLNTQLIAAGCDITKSHQDVKPNIVEERKSRSNKINIQRNVSSTSAMIKMIPCTQTKSYKLSNVIKPIEYSEMQRMSRDSFYRILYAKDICQNARIHQKIISSLVYLSKESFHDNYLIADIHQRYDLAFAWIYEEYVHANGYLAAFEANKKKDFTKYDHLLCQFLEYLQENDHDLFSRLLTNVPFITDNALHILERYCQDQVKSNCSDFGMKILRNLILHRIPIREKSFNILLNLTQNENNSIRTNAIYLTKILYQRKEFKQEIEKYAVKSIQTFETGFHGAKDVSIEDSSRLCFSLCLHLMPLNHCLIQPFANLYTTVNENIQRIILQILEVPIREMGATSSEILKLIKTCPEGAESLIIHVIHILTEQLTPPDELVKNIKDLYYKRISDIRFLIPILPYLEKYEIQNVLPKLIKLPSSIVKEVFDQFLASTKISHVCPISPSELFIALHQISLEECELKIIIHATTLCLNERSIYTDLILAKIIEHLVEMTPIPLLFMRTVLQTLCLYPKMVNFMMNILQRLITKQAWKQPRIWEGFIKCCEKTRPHSFPLLLQLPPVELKHVFQKELTLHDSLRHYLRSMSIAQRLSIPSSVLEVIENNSFLPSS